jgi:hypothetical protein
MQASLDEVRGTKDEAEVELEAARAEVKTLKAAAASSRAGSPATTPQATKELARENKELVEQLEATRVALQEKAAQAARASEEAREEARELRRQLEAATEARGGETEEMAVHEQYDTCEEDDNEEELDTQGTDAEEVVERQAVAISPHPAFGMSTPVFHGAPAVMDIEPVRGIVGTPDICHEFGGDGDGLEDNSVEGKVNLNWEDEEQEGAMEEGQGEAEELGQPEEAVAPSPPSVSRAGLSERQTTNVQVEQPVAKTVRVPVRDTVRKKATGISAKQENDGAEQAECKQQ